MKLPTWLGHVTAAILSFLAAFFATFNVLFSDIFGLKAMAGAVLYVFFVYFIISLLLYWLWPLDKLGTGSGRGKAWRIWLIVPGGAFALFIALSDFSRLVYPLAVMAAVVLGSWAGQAVFRKRTT